MTASMIVTLGIQFSPQGRWGRENGRPPKKITISVDSEIDPEDVFKAANRIDETSNDVARLPLLWQKALRMALDEVKAPSMSVEDTIELVSADGVSLGGWRVESFGFSGVAPIDTARWARA